VRLRLSPARYCRGLNNVKGTRAYITSLVVAFVVLSALADRGGATQRIITGKVAEVQAGEWMVVASEMTDPGGIQIVLGATTVYEAREHDAVLDSLVMRPGVRATIWYRRTGERHPVADRVRVLPDTAIP
jgi:hypothetical protein